MNLFDDTELFSTGNFGKRIIDAVDADLLLIDNLFTKEQSDQYYKALLHNTLWREYEMPMYSKRIIVPRMIAWHQDDSGRELSVNQNWTQELLSIRERVQIETELKFNAVLLNLYRNGKDGVSWHSDRTDSCNRDMNIASVTFGQTRMFRLRHKFLKHVPQIEIRLHHGSMLLMAGSTNTFWEHQIPKTARDVLPRINLTFRQIRESKTK